MKKFDYNKAKAGAEICTKSGNNVRVVCWDKNSNGTKQMVVLIERAGTEKILLYNTDGTPDSYQDDGMELIMKPKLHDGWVLVLNGGDDEQQPIVGEGGYIYETEQDAYESNEETVNRGINRIAHIVWEE